MKNLLLVIFCLCTLAASAQKETKPETTSAGTVVYNYTHKKGPRITYGSSVLIHAHTWLNDSLVQSSRRDFGEAREFTLPDSVAMSQRTVAIFDGLRVLTNGDSATILQTVDSMLAKQIPPEFGVVKVIRYEVKVMDVLTPEKKAKREKQAEAKRKKVLDKEAEVGKIVAKYLSDYNAGKLKKKLKKTNSGLEYVIL
ncbi:MAG: hypothetical protein JNJ57_18400, partial [Saprospiraceae bacterium]|nr:hypothetical protein [Saprospiraceae bacterium]